MKTRLKNPLYKFWRKHGDLAPLDCLTDRYTDAFKRRRESANRWSWAVPTDKHLRRIAKLSPILEVGAGWATGAGCSSSMERR